MICTDENRRTAESSPGRSLGQSLAAGTCAARCHGRPWGAAGPSPPIPARAGADADRPAQLPAAQRGLEAGLVPWAGQGGSSIPPGAAPRGVPRAGEFFWAGCMHGQLRREFWRVRGWLVCLGFFPICFTFCFSITINVSKGWSCTGRPGSQRARQAGPPR